MKRLALTREHLAELTSDELAAVPGGRDMVTNPCPLPTHGITELTTITTGF